MSQIILPVGAANLGSLLRNHRSTRFEVCREREPTDFVPFLWDFAKQRRFLPDLLLPYRAPLRCASPRGQTDSTLEPSAIAKDRRAR